MSFEQKAVDPYIVHASRLSGRTTGASGIADPSNLRRKVGHLKESGLPSVQIAVHYGGKGASWTSVLGIVRELARADGALALLYGFHHLPLHAVLSSASFEARDRLLRRSADENWVWGRSDNVRTSGRRKGRGWLISGRGRASPGASTTDYLHVSWQDETGTRLAAAIPRWSDGIDTGEEANGESPDSIVAFRDVSVADDDLLWSSGAPVTPFASLGPLLRSAVLLNVFVGTAEGALAEARGYTAEKSRPWVYSGYERHTDDPFVRRTYGSLHIRTLAAAALADKAAAALDAVYARGLDLSQADYGRAAVAVATANVYASKVALDVSSDIFAVMGARSATRTNDFDRFWRIVRTHTLQDPAERLQRVVGDWLLTGAYHPSPIGDVL